MSEPQPTLFEPEPATGYTLWHRPSSRHKWQPVGTTATRQEAVNSMDQVGSGQFTILPAGEEPGPRKQL